jgi:hypothetical protein
MLAGSHIAFALRHARIVFVMTPSFGPHVSNQVCHYGRSPFTGGKGTLRRALWQPTGIRSTHDIKRQRTFPVLALTVPPTLIVGEAIEEDSGRESGLRCGRSMAQAARNTGSCPPARKGRSPRSAVTNCNAQNGWAQYSTGRMLPCLTVTSCGEIEADASVPSSLPAIFGLVEIDQTKNEGRRTVV